ncbi:MAG: alpha/beta fold hydrolase [Tardiphaga sp.]|uniref:alpha/beta hydrolase n=1 Tax=Tardiphaga sp. TaxID=1926292 RepID=UPI001995DE2E|nr:alpha/beta fold hydrolase [Tardiphaga sp.]MBC7583269.1 alpha/beta fold hydrolase [Tardiphaga sp.]
MVRKILSFGVRVVVRGLAAAGLVALLLAGLIATPLHHPPELPSISEARKFVDLSNLPVLQRYAGSDGTALAYRHYRPVQASTDRIAIVVHGSSGSSGGTIHALSSALMERGVQTYAVDIRGHGASGTRGDIGYVGQLEDDLANLVAVVRQDNPTAPLTLIGHSSGGGFALRIAGSAMQNLFDRTVLLAPYLGYDAPTNQPDGGWARADVPRIIGLLALAKLGITCCDHLPVVAFAVPPGSTNRLVATYSERLRSNFGTHPDFRTDLAAARRPITLFSGSADELMDSGRYEAAMRSVLPSIKVRLLPGINHMGIVADARAVSVIADDVVKSEVSSR